MAVALVSHPPPRLDPTRSLGMPLTANQVYDNFPALLSMDRAMEYLALVEEIGELGEDS